MIAQKDSSAGLVMVCRPLSLSCLNVKCKADSLCIDDKVNGPRCVPVADLLKEGEVCSHNGDVKGECVKGLECRPRDGCEGSRVQAPCVQTLVAESICQKPAVVDPAVRTCATMLCIATTTCVEDKVNDGVQTLVAESICQKPACEVRTYRARHLAAGG
eukprot:TRINITY_DN625_c0_g1_i19.p3 TRINITY_DN625_c0_g1~~TRINITY_DN625_c0_g1_i19.p3  ORF type:complete len:159 (+),score=29.23 TRINITY_DN625_c0_g1_i19:142-618(+)